jgi:hypothetical protein
LAFALPFFCTVTGLAPANDFDANPDGNGGCDSCAG